MAQATWNGAVLAESDDVVEVEGNLYFPPEAMRREHFEESTHHSTCPWKGQASYYHLVVAGERNENAAWTYPRPKAAAAEIAGRIAFWKGVTVQR